MATTSVRTAVKDKIIALLDAHDALNGVTVSYGFPGPGIEYEHVWCGRVIGTVKIPLMKAGRKARDDKFTITIVFMSARPGDSELESEQRIERFYAAIEDVLADDPGLEEIDGLVSAVLDEVEGPITDPTDEGHASFMRADIYCHSRLT